MRFYDTAIAFLLRKPTLWECLLRALRRCRAAAVKCSSMITRHRYRGPVPGLTLATTRVSCSYYHELSALDEVLIRMSARSMSPGRLTMLFQYFRAAEDGGEILIAEGEQEVACVLRVGSHLQPAPLPAALRHAVEKYIAPMAEPPRADNQPLLASNISVLRNTIGMLQKWATPASRPTRHYGFGNLERAVVLGPGSRQVPECQEHHPYCCPAHPLRSNKRCVS